MHGPDNVPFLVSWPGLPPAERACALVQRHWRRRSDWRGGANPLPWGAWTSLQVGGLTVVSVLAVGTAVLLVRRRQPRGSSAKWRNDWLGDVVLVCRRTRARNITETSVVAGCLATLIAIAFHDSLWSAVTTGPLTIVALVSLTLGAGVVVSLATAALLRARSPYALAGPRRLSARVRSPAYRQATALAMLYSTISSIGSRSG